MARASKKTKAKSPKIKASRTKSSKAKAPSRSTRGGGVRVVRLPHGAGLVLPAYQTAEAAGMDLAAAVPDGKPLRLKKGQRALVPTGLMFELPVGFEAQIRPRSGLAFKHGVTVLNAPGTIDSDYRGEVQVLLVNFGDKTFSIARGERIAQMVIAPVVQVALAEAATARATQRGAGGFGSTGAAAKGAVVSKSGGRAKTSRASAKSGTSPNRKGAKVAAKRSSTKRAAAKTVAAKRARKAVAKPAAALSFARRPLRDGRRR